MKYLSNVFAVVILAFVLMSDKVNINLNHHLMLPDIAKTQAIYSHFHWNFTQGTFTTTDIYLSDEIKSVINYESIAELLDAAKKGDVVIFHLAGYGGDGNTMRFLINHIKATKALTIASVEAPIYSAHAYIAINTNKLIMAPSTFLMFHSLSTHNFDCSIYQGETDRGQDQVTKCKQMLDAEDESVSYLIDRAWVLTADEKARIKDGYDVYVSYEQMKTRFPN